MVVVRRKQCESKRIAVSRTVSGGRSKWSREERGWGRGNARRVLYSRNGRELNVNRGGRSRADRSGAVRYSLPAPVRFAETHSVRTPSPMLGLNRAPPDFAE